MTDNPVRRPSGARRRIAFYAPLKSPSHHQPSGDRLVARLLMAALEEGGYRTQLASHLRTWDGSGNGERQARLRDVGTRLGERLLRRYAREEARPDLWFTYHIHHKAPDWIGPLVSERLDIPYVVAEASYAPKREGGPWHLGHVQCRRSVSNADAVFSLNENDLPCLRPLVKPSCRLIDLKPFLDMSDIDRAPGHRQQPDYLQTVPPEVPRLVCVAMMREGDKLASFRRLADVLQGMFDYPWHLVVVGDGEARERVAACFEPLGSRVTMTGVVRPPSLYSILKSCDIYIWPAVNEAYGMSLLEAQACGLPVVAARVGGVPSIVQHGETGLLSAAADPGALQADLTRLLSDHGLRRRMGAAAHQKARVDHDIAGASETLGVAIRELLSR